MQCCNKTIKCKAQQHIAPFAMPKHDNGVLYGLHPNPPQFENFNGSTEYSVSRQQYKNGMVAEETLKKKKFASKSFDLYNSKLKSANVGKNTITNGPLTFKSYDKNLVKQKIQHCRNASCVPPPKTRYGFL
jgi:hypothetical protein